MLVNGWREYIEKTANYFYNLHAEVELVQKMKNWLSSEDFAEKHSHQWTNLLKRSSASKMIRLHDLKTIQWANVPSSLFQEFNTALEGMGECDLTENTSKNIYNYLKANFDLVKEVKQETGGHILILSQGIMFLSSESLNLDIIVEDHKTKYSYLDFRD